MITGRIMKQKKLIPLAILSSKGQKTIPVAITMIRWTVILTALLFTAFPLMAEDKIFPLMDCEALFARRDNPDILRQAIECYQKALAESPGDLQIPTRLSMCYYWKGILNRGEKKQWRPARRL